MVTKLDLAREWLPRYTGMAIDDFGDYVLLTNFENYLIRFVTDFDCEIGAGGMAPVYLATDLRHDRDVAPAARPSRSLRF